MERFRKCGKPSCHCAKPDSPGHGPSYSLTREVENKTITKIIPAAEVEQTRRRIAECKRFRDLAREFIEVSDKVCDAQLHTATDTAPAARLKKTALAEVLQVGLVEELQNLLGEEAVEELDFEALETAVRHRALQIAARALEQRFNSDTSDAASGAQHPCACGQMARYVDRRSKCFQTALGDLTLVRACIVYENTGHVYTGEMKQRMVEWFDRFL